MDIALPTLQELPVQPALQLHTLGDVHVPWRHDGLQTAADKNSKPILIMYLLLEYKHCDCTVKWLQKVKQIVILCAYVQHDHVFGCIGSCMYM